MTLASPVASAVVGGVAMIVAGWGTWLSVGSARRGPVWAHDFLTAWRWMPWGVAGAGAVLLLVLDPVWVGVAVLYIGLVTAVLLRSVRTRLALARDTYDALDLPSETRIRQAATMGSYLTLGALVLAVVAVWDVSVRGWPGVFGLALAAFLGLAGWLVRRRT